MTELDFDVFSGLTKMNVQKSKNIGLNQSSTYMQPTFIKITFFFNKRVLKCIIGSTRKTLFTLQWGKVKARIQYETRMLTHFNVKKMWASIRESNVSLSPD